LRAATLSFDPVSSTIPVDLWNHPQNISFELYLTLPIVGPPDPTDVKIVEAEINNLLAKVKDEPSEIDIHHLEFILLGLLETPLKLLAERVRMLEINLLQWQTLSMIDALVLIRARKEFANKFQIFKNNLPKFGIFLDQWWHSAKSIQETCKRSRAWQAVQPVAIRNLSAHEIISPIVTGWHQVYTDLKTYVDGDVVDAYGAAQRLLFPQSNDPLTVLRDRVIMEVLALNRDRSPTSPPRATITVIDPIASTSTLTDQESKRRLALIQTLKRQLVAQYMTWFTSLTVSIYTLNLGI
jgi:hypothetical protein